MTDSHEDPPPGQEGDGDAAFRLKQQQGEDEEAHGGQGSEQDGPAGDAQAGPGEVGIGGYGDRDPESEMPRVPTMPETQGEKSDVDEADE